MHEKDNYLKTAELSTEQNCNMIDGVPNNTPIQPRRTSWRPSMSGWPKRAFPMPGLMCGRWL